MALARTDATEFAITDKDGDTVVEITTKDGEVEFWRPWPHSTLMSIPIEHIDEAIEVLRLIKAREAAVGDLFSPPPHSIPLRTE